MNYSSIGMRIAISMFWFLCLCGLLWLPSLSSLWSQEKSINILVWAATFHPALIKKFERETGIKVNILYLESNEELFMKLSSSHGAGYDVCMPSDYIMNKLIDQKLIKPLDTSKLNFLDRLSPRLLHLYFDPENIYSVPYFWAIYGLGIDKSFFGNQQPPVSWSLLFDYPIVGAKVGMIGIAREAVLIAAQYLFKNIEHLLPDKINEIQQVLIKQKGRVEAYIDTDVRSNYLLISKGSPVVVTVSPFIAKIMKDYPEIDFIIPQEGSFMIIDNFVISSACKKDDYVYQFINFFYRPEHICYNVQVYPFIPATNDMYELLKEADMPKAIIDAHIDETIPLQFFKPVISEKVVNDIWIAVKTS